MLFRKKYRVFYSKDAKKALNKKGPKKDFTTLEKAHGWAEGEVWAGNTALIVEISTGKTVAVYDPTNF